jgi:hypothetical protein
VHSRSIKLKARHGLPPSDPAGEAEQVSRLSRLAAVSKLDPNFAERFLACVIREVIRHHESIPQCVSTRDYMIERLSIFTDCAMKSPFTKGQGARTALCV